MISKESEINIAILMVFILIDPPVNALVSGYLRFRKLSFLGLRVIGMSDSPEDYGEKVRLQPVVLQKSINVREVDGAAAKRNRRLM